jgi:uncharacterized protein (DUF924 family)
MVNSDINFGKKNDMAHIPATNILNYWLVELGHEKWFQSSTRIDEDIRGKFSGAYEQGLEIAEKRLDDLDLSTANDYLAAIILFDQFPRNMFRGLPQSFATDALGRRLSHQAIANGFDLEFPAGPRIFFYLPFEHSEAIEDQELATALVRERCAVSNYLEYAELHRDLISRFGRFPHRNAILGRPSSPQEIAYLANGGHLFGTTPLPSK